MLAALLNLVASVGAVGVLAGVVSGIIFLVDTALQWGSAQRTSLEPWANPAAAKATVCSAANGAVNGFANGAANGGGAVNGFANGAVNGFANGKVNGAAVNAGDDGVLFGSLFTAANDAFSGVFHGAFNRHVRQPAPPASPAQHQHAIGVPDAWFQPAADAPPLVRVQLQSLAHADLPKDLAGDDAKLPPARRPRSAAGDGESQCDMGESGDVPEVLGVRQLMEGLVESLVSGGLDDVALRPANPHPQYAAIYKRHQPRLRSALTSLAYSLQMAMAQKPLAESETPGRAHAQLRAIILDLARDVANLDKAGAERAGGEGRPADALDGLGQEDFTTRAYEDILATAIVNKVMERSSSRNNKRIINNNNSNFVSSLEVRVGSVEDSPESCTSSYTESWTGSSHLDHSLEDVDSDPLSLMIEECIEEVTTITATSSSSESSSLDERSGAEDEAVREVPVVRRRRRRGSRRRGSATAAALPLPPSGPPSLIAGLSFMKQRVPFPELGVDIVDADWSSSELSEASVRLRNGSDGDSDAEGWRPAPRHEKPDGAEDGVDADGRGQDDGDDDDRPASCLELVTPMQSWEDNWLFQSKRVRKPAAQYAHHPVPVPMLVPNPSEDFRALIGDVDAEETSDLSECSDDALEEVVLAGMATQGDQFSEDLGLSSAHLGGLAETCNLELLRRVAPSLSTAPVPRAHRTDRASNLEQPASPSDRVSPVGKTPSRTSTLSSRSSTRSPVDLAGRWARDQDAEMTVVYDTPTRREAPAKPTATPATKPAAKPPAKAKPAAKQEAVAVVADRPDHVRDDAAAPTPASQQICTEPAEVICEVAKASDVLAEVEPAAVTPVVNGHAAPTVVNGHAAPAAVNGHDAVDAVSADVDDAVLATPPRPGTIAEREHRKWLEAMPLANNPYSPENIQRRLQQRAAQRGPGAVLPGSSDVAAVPEAPEAADGPDPTLHIALRVDPDPKKYGRDFYINSRDGQTGQTGSGLRRSQSTSVADRHHSLLDSPIAPWSSAVRTNGDGGAEESPSPGSPSVRELAKQFLVQPQEPPAPNQIRPARSSDALAKVVIVGKDSAACAAPQHARKAVRQVHSLTARSMSREFREGLRHLATTAGPVPRAATTPSTVTAEAGVPAADAVQGRPDPEGARQPVGAE